MHPPMLNLKPNDSAKATWCGGPPSRAGWA